MDVAEIGLEPLAWKMCQRNECFLMPKAVLQDISLHLGVATEITVLVVKSTMHLRGSMSLFGRSILVAGQNLVNDGMQASEDRCVAISSLRARGRLGSLQDLPDFVPRVMGTLVRSRGCSCHRGVPCELLRNHPP